jgi:acetyl esterase/lipase
MTSIVFLVVAALGIVLTLLLYLPPRSYGALQLVYFMVTFLWGEFALINVILQALSLPLWYSWGAFNGAAGMAGVVLMPASWCGLCAYHFLGHKIPTLLDRALEQGLGLEFRDRLPSHLRDPIPRMPAFRWLEPFPLRIRGSRFIGDLAFGDDPYHRLDLYLPETGDGPWPVLLYVHGGAFFMGDKRQQGRVLYNRVPPEGWAIASINYRLGPEHRMPAMIEDVKRAIAWVRERGGEHGLDGRTIVCAGESAGGFLAMMAAVSANDTAFQPGFEEADTRVQGCVSLYGPNDLLGEHGCFDAEAYQAFNAKSVMPCIAAQDRSLWQRCSPMYRLHADLPPVFVLGGTHDPLVSVEETRQLGEALRRESASPVVTAIYPFSTHAFDQTHSTRATPTVDAVVRFLAWIAATRVPQGSQG